VTAPRSFRGDCPRWCCVIGRIPRQLALFAFALRHGYGAWRQHGRRHRTL
jgi:hypothetical protein